MRIYINELVKAFCKKTTISIFIALTILNGVLLWVNENQKNDTYTASQYKAVFADLKGMSPKEAYDQINAQSQKLYLFDRLSYGEDITDVLAENPEINANRLLSEYKNKKLSEIYK